MENIKVGAGSLWHLQVFVVFIEKTTKTTIIEHALAVCRVYFWSKLQKYTILGQSPTNSRQAVKAKEPDSLFNHIL
ncbi:MAG: hypothetical protein LBG07_01685 [Treponema sp.]|nr:hypothetical protein [Treponema sp.]